MAKRRLSGRRRRDIITFDLDGTLCDSTMRQAMLGAEPDWVEYAMAAGDDPPIMNVVMLALEWQKDYDIWIVSARDAQAMDITRDWLRRQGIQPSGIMLNKSGPLEPDRHPGFKLAALQAIEKGTGQKVRVHFDDYHPVAMLLKESGYNCAYVGPDPFAGGHAPM